MKHEHGTGWSVASPVGKPPFCGCRAAQETRFFDRVRLSHFAHEDKPETFTRSPTPSRGPSILSRQGTSFFCP